MTKFTVDDRPVLLPAEEILPGDLMDRGMDQLRTLYAALAGDSFDASDTLSYSAVLDHAIRDLEIVRIRLQVRRRSHDTL